MELPIKVPRHFPEESQIGGRAGARARVWTGSVHPCDRVCAHAPVRSCARACIRAPVRWCAHTCVRVRVQGTETNPGVRFVGWPVGAWVCRCGSGLVRRRVSGLVRQCVGVSVAGVSGCKPKPTVTVPPRFGRPCDELLYFSHHTTTTRALSRNLQGNCETLCIGMSPQSTPPSHTTAPAFAISRKGGVMCRSAHPAPRAGGPMHRQPIGPAHLPCLVAGSLRSPDTPTCRPPP